MTFYKEISKYAEQVLPHHLLMSWLKNYKRPNDKILGLKAKGYLEALKKGLYIAGPQLTDRKPDPMLVANHIFGPSYVSVDTALSFYGLIPERVEEVTSMTIKTSRSFVNVLGMFSYKHLPLPYYSFGLVMLQLGSNQYALVASPEKAICDKIVTTPGITFRSKQNAYEYLVENMRIDEGALKILDAEMIKKWLNDSPKSESLFMVYKMIKQL